MNTDDNVYSADSSSISVCGNICALGRMDLKTPLLSSTGSEQVVGSGGCSEEALLRGEDGHANGSVFVRKWRKKQSFCANDLVNKE